MDLVNWVTRERFNEYMVAANHDVEAAQELYEWNVAVSAAFFEVISQVEVALRNAVDKALRPLEVPESARLEVSGDGGLPTLPFWTKSPNSPTLKLRWIT